MNHIELSVELMSILRALNYSCELKVSVSAILYSILKIKSLMIPF